MQMYLSYFEWLTFQNASQVLEANLDRRREKNVPTGAAESLAGRALPKMGDRAILVNQEVELMKKKKEQK